MVTVLDSKSGRFEFKSYKIRPLYYRAFRRPWIGILSGDSRSSVFWNVGRIVLTPEKIKAIEKVLYKLSLIVDTLSWQHSIIFSYYKFFGFSPTTILFLMGEISLRLPRVSRRRLRVRRERASVFCFGGWFVLLTTLCLSKP